MGGVYAIVDCERRRSRTRLRRSERGARGGARAKPECSPRSHPRELRARSGAERVSPRCSLRRMSFDDIAGRYARDSTAQRSAAELLLGLAEVGPSDDVLDVGCGTGALLARLRAATTRRVVGVDPSARMIDEARKAAPGAELARMAAEELAYDSEFDLVVSNSALQWFRDPAGALLRFRRALRPGGRTVIQAPATARYAPEFVDAMEDVARDVAEPLALARDRGGVRRPPRGGRLRRAARPHRRAGVARDA